MDFATIGKISTYVKQKNLTFAAKHKIRTGQVLTNSNGNFISADTVAFEKLRDMSKVAADKAKQMKLRRIKNKLLNGKKLSEDEMSFLRANDPKMYKKAMHAEEAREELKAELRKAKSKEEAQEAMSRALVKASSEAMAELGSLGQGGGNLSGNFGGNVSLMQAGGDVMNVSSNEGSAIGNGNVGGIENQTSTEGNTSTNSANESTGDNHDDNKTSADKVQDNQQTKDDDANTPEDIMEKYIMTIRALEDEWAHFTNSKEYKDLPEHTIDAIEEIHEKQTRKRITAPNRKFLEAVALYRKSMFYALN